MTGYGKGNAVKNNFSAEVEIKSVNSRFLELFLKLPPLLSDREYEMREILKSKIKRGKINVTVQLKRNGNNDLVMVNETKLKEYISLIEKIKKTAGIKEEIKIEHVINNREIVSSSDISLSETEFNLVKKTLKSAVGELLNMRKEEGKELAKDLTKRIKAIEKRVVLIEKEFKKSVNSHFNKLKERLKVLTGETELDEQRLNLELAAIADKADITEECVRLKSHLKFFVDSMSKQSEPGRKLNFLCQELNRETNTISSKSISTSLTHNAVLIKEEIEKIREQIQNIE
jgi:uncharacterized protein (TIGR00255 family)